MPTYEYVCTECARHVEAYRSFTDPPLATCEFCGGKLRRIYSPVGISFKGSGFYSNDAKSESKRAKKTAEANQKKAADKSGKSDKSKAKSPAGDSSGGSKSSEGAGSASSGAKSDTKKS
ncbi:MAG: FmdB family zinc ribbon protein [Actinomycetota bacterium]